MGRSGVDREGSPLLLRRAPLTRRQQSNAGQAGHQHRPHATVQCVQRMSWRCPVFPSVRRRPSHVRRRRGRRRSHARRLVLKRTVSREETGGRVAGREPRGAGSPALPGRGGRRVHSAPCPNLGIRPRIRHQGRSQIRLILNRLREDGAHFFTHMCRAGRTMRSFSSCATPRPRTSAGRVGIADHVLQDDGEPRSPLPFFREGRRR